MLIAIGITLGVAFLALCNALGGLMFKSYHSAEHCPWNWRLLLGGWCEPYFAWRDEHHPDWWRHP